MINHPLLAMTEETPTPPPGDIPPADLNKVEADSIVSKRRKLNFWQRIGASGLSVSVAIHVLLVFIAAAFVVSTVTDNAKKDPNAFATGAGGGSGGERVKSTERKVKPKNVKSLAKTTTRITSKSASASIALPDMPNSASASSMISGAMAGGASKGFGGGAGGGIGTGKGMGSGGGKNFVARPVMGANIFSQRLAVYFDGSSSMLPYLPRIAAEIRAKFEDADIYVGDGVHINVVDNLIGGGEKYKGNVNIRGRSTGGAMKKNTKGELTTFETDVSKLTSQGRSLFKKYAENIKKGSVGAWLDIMKDQPAYDALIVVSDFADGVEQFRVKAVGPFPAYKADKGMREDPPSVFNDKGAGGNGYTRSVTIIANGGYSGQPVVQCKDTSGLSVGMNVVGSGVPLNTTIKEVKENISITLTKPLTAAALGRLVCSVGDRRLPEERKWEDEWVQTFATARDDKAPRLYMISTSRTYANRPGTILEKVTSASGGAAILIKFGSALKGTTLINNLTPSFAGNVRGNGTIVDFDDVYVGMPISGPGIAKDAVVVEGPLFKDVKKEDGRSERQQTRPMKISAPLTEDVADGVFTFTPLVQAVGTITKDSKTIEDLSGSVDLHSGMLVQDGRFPAGTKIVAVVPNKASPGLYTVEMSAPAINSGANVVIRFRPGATSATGNRSAAPAR
jgi:hypothetical protein